MIPNDGRSSITPSGFFGNSAEYIVSLENFMTDEEIEFLEAAAKNITIWDDSGTSQYDEDGTCTYDASYWADRVASGDSLDQNDKRIKSIIENMQERLGEEIKRRWDMDVIPTGTTIVKWRPGQYQHPHADKELHEGQDRGKPNAFPWYDIASLFYLNDDYDGGELYFPVQGIQFKPKKGAAYFFPGDMNFIHGVTEIKNSNRYTCPFFWTITKHGESWNKNA